MNPNSAPKTIICDIDGTLLYHHGGQFTQLSKTQSLLPGVMEKFEEWGAMGYSIVLMTGRRESERKRTASQLESLGIFYDQLVMGVSCGQRVLINDLKPGREELTAIGVCVNRNEGLGTVTI
jgi:hydroxymethylpyrimidine pyrophosphatase-like HAD family hydrolase